MFDFPASTEFGKRISKQKFYENIGVERHAEKESYAGVCDDLSMGVTIIFYVQNVVDFLIIAMSIFLFVKLINKMRNLRARKEEIAERLAAEQAAPKGPSSEELLTEIRDLLRAQHGTDPGQA